MSQVALNHIDAERPRPIFNVFSLDAFCDGIDPYDVRNIPEAADRSVVQWVDDQAGAILRLRSCVPVLLSTPRGRGERLGDLYIYTVP